MDKDNKYFTFSVCIEAIHDPRLQPICLRSRVLSQLLDFTVFLAHGMSPSKDNGLGQFFPRTKNGYSQFYRTCKVNTLCEILMIDGLFIFVSGKVKAIFEGDQDVTCRGKGVSEQEMQIHRLRRLACLLCQYAVYAGDCFDVR
jgi:hypothetical protein